MIGYSFVLSLGTIRLPQSSNENSFPSNLTNRYVSITLGVPLFSPNSVPFSIKIWAERNMERPIYSYATRIRAVGVNFIALSVDGQARKRNLNSASPQPGTLWRDVWENLLHMPIQADRETRSLRSMRRTRRNPLVQPPTRIERALLR